VAEHLFLAICFPERVAGRERWREQMHTRELLVAGVTAALPRSTRSHQTFVFSQNLAEAAPKRQVIVQP